jgi:ribosome-associated translation inhibitor RaiA
MQLELVDSNLIFTDRFKERIVTKFSTALDKYLTKLDPEYQIARLSIQKVARFGYQMKFSMELPFTHIYITNNSPDLMPGIINIRNQVARQIRENREKLRQSNEKGLV